MTILTFLLISLAIQLVLFIPAFFFRTDKLTDLSYSLTFFVLTLIAFLQSSLTIPQILLFSLVTLWAFRLGIFLFIRINKMKKDTRFDDIRDSVIKFGRFWLFQGIVVWILLIPTFYFLSQPSQNPFYLGLLIAFFGLAFEAIADYQKYCFKNQKKNKGKFISSGLWRYSRHPNYFGEILVWLGIYLFTIPTFTPFQTALAFLSPLTIFLILRFATGIPMLEKKYNKIYKNNKSYQTYRKSTNLLKPWFPRSK
jgi:steroid 5-alpha reductase family enzyme